MHRYRTPADLGRGRESVCSRNAAEESEGSLTDDARGVDSATELVLAPGGSARYLTRCGLY